MATSGLDGWDTDKLGATANECVIQAEGIGFTDVHVSIYPGGWLRRSRHLGRGTQVAGSNGGAPHFTC